MTLFDEEYVLEGAAALDYAMFYAEQAFGAVTPFDTDTGKILVTMGTWLQGPKTCNDIAEQVYVKAKNANEQPVIYSDKIVVKRFATAYLGVPESLFDDSEWLLIGDDLLAYYLRMLRLIGFEDVAAAIATSLGHTRATFTTGHGAASMYMTWGNQSFYDKRFKALTVNTTDNVRYKLAMLQIFISKITNEQVLKAVMQAMSIYICWSHPTLADKSIESIWKGEIKNSLF